MRPDQSVVCASVFSLRDRNFCDPNRDSSVKSS